MDNQEKEDSYKTRLSFEFEVEQIRSKYLPQDQNKLEQLKKLDKQSTVPGKKAILIMSIISLLFIASSIFIFTSAKWILTGAICGVLGVSTILLMKPVYSLVTEKERTRLAPQIMRLSDEILGKSPKKNRNMD